MQAYTAAGVEMFAVILIVALVEPFKYVIEIFLMYADTCITDRYTDTIRFRMGLADTGPSCLYAYQSSFRSEFDGIGEQVVDYTGDFFGIKIKNVFVCKLAFTHQVNVFLFGQFVES